MARTQAQHQRAYRERRRTGAQVFRGESSADLVTLLIGCGLLPADGGAGELGAALEDIADRWRRGDLGPPPRLYGDGD